MFWGRGYNPATMRSQSKNRPTGARRNYTATKASGSKASGGKPSGGKSHGDRKPSKAPAASFRGDSERTNPKERRDGYIPEPKGGRLVMGQHAINEVLKVRPKSIAGLVLRDRWEHSEELRELESDCRKLGIKVETRNEAALDRVGTHQGAMLQVNGVPEFDIESLQDKATASLLVLDGVEDPHNLGAVLRTAWLMGVSACIIPEDRAVGLTPVVHKVASGGVEHVPVVRVQNFANFFSDLKEQGFWIFGLSHESKGTIFDLKVPEKVVWVLGAEDKGMRVTTERLCDELVRIPQISADASYNVSVSAAIALTESFRQQNLAK